MSVDSDLFRTAAKLVKTLSRHLEPYRTVLE